MARQKGYGVSCLSLLTGEEFALGPTLLGKQSHGRVSCHLFQKACDDLHLVKPTGRNSPPAGGNRYEQRLFHALKHREIEGGKHLGEDSLPFGLVEPEQGGNNARIG